MYLSLKTSLLGRGQIVLYFGINTAIGRCFGVLYNHIKYTHKLTIVGIVDVMCILCILLKIFESNFYDIIEN